MKQLLAVLLALVGVSGCSTPRPNVEADWGETMSRYNFIGIFPVSEDYQPGDIILDVPPAPGADPQPRRQRLGSFAAKPLVKALRDQEQDRLFMEGDAPAGAQAAADKGPVASTVSNTTTAQPGAIITTTTSIHAASAPQAPRVQGNNQPGKAGAKPQPDPNAPMPPAILAAESIPHMDDPTPRMRRVALPGIVAARVYDYQISGAGPLGRVAVGLGLAGQGSSAVVITLKRLETLGFDVLAANTLLYENIAEWLALHGMDAATLLSLTYAINPSRVVAMCRGDKPEAEDNRSLIRVVNRVLYTRDIAYEYARTSSTGGRMAADFSQASGTGRLLVPGGSAPAPAQPSAGSSATAASAADAEQARVSATQSGLAATPSNAGIRTTVGVGSFGDASLIDTYTRPMAVGFNAVRSFTVRGSLVTIGPTVQKSNDQLDAARAFCRPLAPDMYTDGAFTPIEVQVCHNTRELHMAHDPTGMIVVPNHCSRAASQPLEAVPFRSIGAQARDKLAGS